MTIVGFSFDAVFNTHRASQLPTCKEVNGQELSTSLLLELQAHVLRRMEFGHPMVGLWRLSITRMET